MEALPVVDFSALSLEKQNSELQDGASIDYLSRQLIDAFTTVGFVYLTNHGMSPAEVTGIHDLAHELFDLPADVKNKYHYDRKMYLGYTPLAAESANIERPGDLKECFDLIPSYPEYMPTEVPNCDQRITTFYQKCGMLSTRIMDGISRGLQLQDKDLFRKSHSFTGAKTQTKLRLLHYPPLPNTVKPNQIRLGEHSDYGTITLLFQDDIGGLELLNQNGEWADATPVPGAVLVNVADFLQRWTADKLKSTMHRVKIPAEELRRRLPRYSVVYFVLPDTDCMIECLDGSMKYPPITSGEYLMQKLSSTYK